VSAVEQLGWSEDSNSCVRSGQDKQKHSTQVNRQLSETLAHVV